MLLTKKQKRTALFFPYANHGSLIQGISYIASCTYDKFKSDLTLMLSRRFAKKQEHTAVCNYVFNNIENSFMADRFSKTIAFGSKKYKLPKCVHTQHLKPSLLVHALFLDNAWHMSAIIIKQRLPHGRSSKDDISECITTNEIIPGSTLFFTENLQMTVPGGNHYPGVVEAIRYGLPFRFTHNGKIDIAVFKEGKNLRLHTPIGSLVYIGSSAASSHTMTYSEAQRLLFHNDIGKLVGRFTDSIPLQKTALSSTEIDNLRLFRTKVLDGFVANKLSEKIVMEMDF